MLNDFKVKWFCVQALWYCFFGTVLHPAISFRFAQVSVCIIQFSMQLIDNQYFKEKTNFELKFVLMKRNILKLLWYFNVFYQITKVG